MGDFKVGDYTGSIRISRLLKRALDLRRFAIE